MSGLFCMNQGDIGHQMLILKRLLALVIFGWLVIGGSGCEKPPVREPALKGTVADGADRSHQVAFASTAADRRLHFRWPQQPRPMRSNEAFGCGCASFDLDNDGWQDILLVGDPHPQLFRNDRSGQFDNITNSTGLQNLDADWTGCAIGDYDGDGWLDCLLTGVHRLALLRNLQGERFEEVTLSAGLDTNNHNQWGASAGFSDLDLDGWLDLVILNYVQFGPESKQYCELQPGIKSGCPPKEYPPERGEIWRNNGRGGFELIPAEHGMQSTSGVGLVLAFSDLDDDQRIDFYIGNDGVPADLMHNLGGMRFENIGVASGLALGPDATPMAAMGADWSDFDRDGRLDLAVSNFEHRAFAVFRNEGTLFFSDATHRVGVDSLTRSRLGFGSNWFDFDNDGWPDLAFVNGHVYDNAQELDPRSSFRQPSLLLRNEQGRRFVDLVPSLGTAVAQPLVGRGSATLDFDNDGAVDFLAVDYEGTPFLLHNQTKSSNSWITFDLRGTAPNRFAYGARVVAKSSQQVWIAEVSPASSYLSSKDPRIHWGLGSIDRLESVTIRWPSGKVQTLDNVPVNQILRIDEEP